jgi:hypothetical protein
MNKLLIYLTLGVSVVLFGSCQGSEKVAALQKAIENAHDETMKEMTDMDRVSRSLKTKLAKMDSLHTTGPERDTLVKTLADMQAAEDHMMTWMEAYNPPEGKAEADALHYLEDQKVKIEKNHQEIVAALNRGKKLDH